MIKLILVYLSTLMVKCLESKMKLGLEILLSSCVMHVVRVGIQCQSSKAYIFRSEHAIYLMFL